MIQTGRGSHPPPRAGPVPSRAPPSSGVSPGPPTSRSCLVSQQPCVRSGLLPAPEELDARAPGLGSLAGPAGAAKGIQGLWAGFVGKGPRGSHGRDEGGGRVSRGEWYLESSGSSTPGGWAGQLGPSPLMVLWLQRGADMHSRPFHGCGEEAPGARTPRAAGSPQPQPVQFQLWRDVCKSCSPALGSRCVSTQHPRGLA